MKQKTIRVNLRVTETCSDLWQAMAKKRGLPLTGFVEVLMREEWERQMKKVGGPK